MTKKISPEKIVFSFDDQDPLDEFDIVVDFKKTIKKSDHITIVTKPTKRKTQDASTKLF